MGAYITKIQLKFNWNNANPARVLLLGLDNAGKTCILYKVKLNEIISTIPTIGFNVETVSPCDGITFIVWDVGGQHKIRKLWRYYYHKTDGLFFVVDSCDTERIEESANELHTVLQDEAMKNAPVVIIANKQDLPNALNCQQLQKKLRLDKLTSDHKWYIQSACAIDGQGIYEAMLKMSEFIKSNRRKQ